LIVKIIVAISIIFIFLIIYTIFNNKFQFVLIKIDKAEEDISLYLDKKKELLDRSRGIIKKELKLDEFLEELESFSTERDNIENHNILKNFYNELFKVIDENEKLLKSESLVNILEDLNNNEENIIGSIKFYNDTVVEYNQLVVSFPSRLVAFIRRYKKRDFYNNEKREIFKILSNK